MQMFAHCHRHWNMVIHVWHVTTKSANSNMESIKFKNCKTGKCKNQMKVNYQLCLIYVCNEMGTLPANDNDTSERAHMINPIRDRFGIKFVQEWRKLKIKFNFNLKDSIKWNSIWRDYSTKSMQARMIVKCKLRLQVAIGTLTKKNRNR